jgi:MoxR-like ATPase
MANLTGIIQDIEKINTSLREYTSKYFNSSELFSIREEKIGKNVSYDIVDIMLLGALTNSDVLLAGGTGKGKSHLSRMVMNGLYGEDNFVNLTVTPGLNEGDFIDIDFDGIKNKNKTKKEAIETTPLLTQPGAIINEINRTPEILQNLFISYLERIFSVKGIEFPVGVELEGKSAQDPHYQFRMISINEGAGYSGTSGMDRAVNDRVVLDVPMDHFRPSISDKRKMINTRNNSDLSIKKTNGGKLEEVMDVVKNIDDVSYSSSAEEFLVYLSGLDNCVESPTHSKTGINFKKQDICNGCHNSKDSTSDKENICGSVYAPSDRSLINLKKIGRAVAVMRAYKTIDHIARDETIEKDKAKEIVKDYMNNLTVTVDDLVAVAPFVLTSKMIIDPAWIDSNFNGSKYLATKHVISTAAQKFKKYVASGVYTNLVESDGKITPEIKTQLETYAKEKDAWAYSLLGDQNTKTNDRNVEFTDLL